MPRDTFQSEDSGAETDSDDDYELNNDEITELVESSGLDGEVILDLWKAQRGLCRVSDLPMSQGLYQPTIAPRIVNQKISKTNAIMVCRVVEQMRSSTSLSWKTFVALLNNISKDTF